MPKRRQRFERNVRMDAGPTRRGMERILLSNPLFNRVLSWTGQAVLALAIWPRFVAPFRWELTRFEMPLAGLGAALDGYRILQLTDLHVGKTRQSYLERVVERCLEERAELIAITGDLIDYEPRALPLLEPLLKRIVRGAGADGVCAIFGNHDYNEYSWRHNGPRSARRTIQRRLVAMIQDAGIKLLRNEQLTITRGDARLTIVGLDEMWTGLADARAAFAGLSAGEAVICLQHNPDGIEFLRNCPWQLMLCGHSHGGQVVFPLMGALYVPMAHREYVRGFYKFPPSPGADAGVPPRVMFVSRGLGYSTPIRLRCRPEASVFTLRAREK